MHPVLFSIGKFKLYSFGSFIGIGTIIAGYFLFWAARSRKLPTAPLFDLVLYTLLGGLIGARIGYYILYQEQFQSFWQIIYFWEGGLAAIPGLLTGFLVFRFTLSRENLPVWPLADIGAIGLLIGWSVGKLGCELSGCTVGRSTNFLAINGSHPVDLYSAVFALVLAGVCFYLWTRKKLRDGVVFFLATEALFLGEFLLKTLKADFGEGTSRLEAVTYLLIIIITYAIFLRLHGPVWREGELAERFKRLVRRRPR
jgi:phosphatidylglycerol:prolipoprotein diacylglycerol transferase